MATWLLAGSKLGPDHFRAWSTWKLVCSVSKCPKPNTLISLLRAFICFDFVRKCKSPNPLGAILAVLYHFVLEKRKCQISFYAFCFKTFRGMKWQLESVEVIVGKFKSNNVSRRQQSLHPWRHSSPTGRASKSPLYLTLLSAEVWTKFSPSVPFSLSPSVTLTISTSEMLSRLSTWTSTPTGIAGPVGEWDLYM